jgi:membrane protein required for colicin V production
MGTLDIVLTGVLFLFFVIGFVKGLVRTIIHLLAMVLTVYMVFNSGHLVRQELMKYFSFNPTISTVLAYIVMILVIMLMAKFITLIMSKLVEILQLKFLNRLLGGLFGVLNGVFFIIIFLVLIEFLPVQEEFYRATKDSYIINYVKNIKNNINLDIPDFTKPNIPDFTKPKNISEEIINHINNSAQDSKKTIEDLIKKSLEK